MNLKQAKRIRRNVKRAIDKARIAHGMTAEVPWTAHVRLLVDSERYDATINGKRQANKALQIRLLPECPRAIYQRVKDHVTRSRRQGISSHIRIPISLGEAAGDTGSAQHERAAAV